MTVETLERPLYDVREAAAVLRMPASTLRRRTEVLAELIDAGEPLDDIADGYGLSPVELRAALAYEYEPAAA